MAIILALLMFVVPVGILGILLIKWANKPSKKKAVEPKQDYRIERSINWVVDSDNVEKFVRYYRDELQENEDYFLPNKDILEDFMEGEKIYKYEPLELPLKMEGKDVYSYIDEDQWIKIGRLKKNADLDGKLTLYLYVNTYKRVNDDSVGKDSGDSYFGVECMKKINL